MGAELDPRCPPRCDQKSVKVGNTHSVTRLKGKQTIFLRPHILASIPTVLPPHKRAPTQRIPMQESQHKGERDKHASIGNRPGEGAECLVTGAYASQRQAHVDSGRASPSRMQLLARLESRLRRRQGLATAPDESRPCISRGTSRPSKCRACRSDKLPDREKRAGRP